MIKQGEQSEIEHEAQHQDVGKLYNFLHFGLAKQCQPLQVGYYNLGDGYNAIDELDSNQDQHMGHK